MTIFLALVALVVALGSTYAIQHLRKLHAEEKRTWVRGLHKLEAGNTIPMRNRGDTHIDMVVLDVSYVAGEVTATMQDRASYVRERTRTVFD